MPGRSIWLATSSPQSEGDAHPLRPGVSINSVLRRSAIVFGMGLIALTGCGDEAADRSGATATDAAPVSGEAAGADLSGVTIDVRRDPG